MFIWSFSFWSENGFSSPSCDRYYCFLVPLTLPVLVVAVYFHWLSMKMFKHAWFFLEPIRSGASCLAEQVTKKCVYSLPLQEVLETFRFYKLPKYLCPFGLCPNILSNTCITGTFPYLHISHQLLALTIVMSVPSHPTIEKQDLLSDSIPNFGYCPRTCYGINFLLGQNPTTWAFFLAISIAVGWYLGGFDRHYYGMKIYKV